MAKKDKKKSKKKDNTGADAVGAVRTAVEKTFHATAEGAQSTRTRAQDLVDEVAGAAGRLREMVEQLGVLEDLKKQVDTLARRVQALESNRGGASRKPAASSRSTAKKRSSSTRAKSSGGTTRAKSSGGTSRAKKASSSSRSTASRSSGSRKPSSSSSAKKPSSS
jgi:hypothetical protein